MSVCSKCGGKVADGSGILKTMQTGTYAGGGAFMREMSLCPKCAAAHDASERTRKVHKLLVLLLAIVAAGAGAVWWFFLRTR